MAQQTASIALGNRLAEILLSLDFQAGLLAGLVLLVLGLLGPILRAKSRVVWGLSHQFTFTLKPSDPKQNTVFIATRSLYLVNWGNAPAENIEVHFTFRPTHFQLWPPLAFREAGNPADDFVVFIDNLGIREEVTIEMLHDNVHIPNVTKVRTPRGNCEFVNFAMFRRFPAWVNISLGLLVLVGAFALLKAIFEALFRVLGTPL